MASPFFASSAPTSMLARAAAILMRLTARTISGWSRSPLIGKLAIARAVWRPSSRDDAVGREHSDQDLLQVAQVAMEIAAGWKLREGEDGVGQDLARAMVGDVAAPLDGNHVHAARPEPCFRGDQILGVSRAAHGQDRLVLGEGDRVAHGAPGSRG